MGERCLLSGYVTFTSTEKPILLNADAVSGVNSFPLS